MKSKEARELEPEWGPLVQALAAMITLSAEYVVLQTYTPHDGECGPYVQTLQEEGGALTLEAASNDFLDPPIGPDAINTLLELGWTAPTGEDGLPNFRFFLDASDVNPRAVADFLIRTLRDAYMITPSDNFEFAPPELFVEVMSGDFGASPSLQFTTFDLENWKNTRGPWH